MVTSVLDSSLLVSFRHTFAVSSGRFRMMGMQCIGVVKENKIVTVLTVYLFC